MQASVLVSGNEPFEWIHTELSGEPISREHCVDRESGLQISGYNGNTGDDSVICGYPIPKMDPFPEYK